MDKEKNKLRFPKIENYRQKSQWLDMEDYLKFVEFNIKYTMDLSLSSRQRKKHPVNVFFKL